jgi:hypothetical protein
VRSRGIAVVVTVMVEEREGGYKVG